MKVKRCKNCKWSTKRPDRAWNLFCINPLVNIKDTWYLAKPEAVGTECVEQRGKGLFKPCGLKGKLYEDKRK